jgi:hypothetical protein
LTLERSVSREVRGCRSSGVAERDGGFPVRGW